MEAAMFDALMLATSLTLTEPPREDVAGRVALMLDQTLERLSRIEDGERVAEYTLCWLHRDRSRFSPYFEVLSPGELFRQSDAIKSEFEALAGEFSDVLEYANFYTVEFEAILSEAVELEMDRRDQSAIGCRYTLVPDPNYLSRVAEAADYRRSAERGEADPAADYRAMTDAELSVLTNQSNREAMLEVLACLATLDPYERNQLKVRMADIAADPERFEADLSRQSVNRSRFQMVDDFYDADRIWREAVADLAPAMSDSECEGVLSQYAEG
jgi:hypothetical protein